MQQKIVNQISAREKKDINNHLFSIKKVYLNFIIGNHITQSHLVFVINIST